MFAVVQIWLDEEERREVTVFLVRAESKEAALVSAKDREQRDTGHYEYDEVEEVDEEKEVQCIYYE